MTFHYHFSPALRIDAVSEDSLVVDDTVVEQFMYSNAQLPAIPLRVPNTCSGGDAAEERYTPRYLHEQETRGNGKDTTQVKQSYAKEPFMAAIPLYTTKRISPRERRGDGTGGIVSNETKRRRTKLLEKEFGPILDEEKVEKHEVERRRKAIDEKIAACMDTNGNLVTQGPKKRSSFRWMQALLSLAIISGCVVFIVSLYALVLILFWLTEKNSLSSLQRHQAQKALSLSTCYMPLLR